MKRISVLLVLIAFPSSHFFAMQAGAAIPRSLPLWGENLQTPVRIRLAKDLEKIGVQGISMRLTSPDAKSAPVVFGRSDKVAIERVQTANGDCWKIRSVVAGLEQIDVRREAILIIDGIDLRQGNQSLPGRLVLSAKTHRFDLVGVLSLEEYLVGVISSEMPLSWPIEALKAQAIAARSYSLAVMRERRKLHYDVENNVMDQMFKHISPQLTVSKRMLKARQAVSETKGVVLLDQKGKVTKAFYHADCGGHTSPSKAIWGIGDSTPTVMDSSCPGHPRSKWSLSLSEPDLREKIKRRIAYAGPIAELRPSDPTGHQRRATLKVIFQNGAQREMNANEFREALGFSELRSTFFTVEKEGDEFHFQGKGWGHGVGLCQWGTRHLAGAGQGAFEILKHYYPLSQVTGEIKGSPTVALRRTELQL